MRLLDIEISGGITTVCNLEMNLGHDYVNRKMHLKNDNLGCQEVPQCVWLIREVKIGITQVVEFLRWRKRVGHFGQQYYKQHCQKRSNIPQKLSFGGWRCRNRTTSSACRLQVRKAARNHQFCHQEKCSQTVCGLACPPIMCPGDSRRKYCRKSNQ